MASATEIKQVQLPNSTTKYDLIAKNGIFYIEGTGSTAGTWLGAHDDITEYYEGLIVAYKVPVAGASTTKLNINNLGAVTVVKNATTGISTAYPVNSVVLLIYTFDSTTAYWKVAEQNSTYSNASLGQGYGTCSTAEATVAKVVSLSSYALATGGIVAVKFTNAVCANATMNINGKGAKAIYYKGAAIPSGVIGAGEIGVFIYNGSQYHLLTVDRNRFFTSLVPYGTQITASESAPVDLNTTTYLKVGNYFCSQNAQAKYITNIPETGVAFMMAVSSPLSQTVDNETGTWVYRIRTLTHYQGTEYVQYCYSNGDNVWSYGPWNKVIKSNNIVSTTAAGLMSAADKVKLDGITSGATANTGTITEVKAGNGLTGGGTSGSVTLDVGAGVGIAVTADAVKAKLRSETALTVDSAAATTTSGRVYPVAVDKTGYLAVNVPWTDTNTNTTYTLSTGDSNGQIKVTPSSGDPYNVSVKGLGSNAYSSTSYLPTAGGNITGHIYLTGAKESSSTGNTSQIVFGTSSSNHVAISSNNNALVINPTTTTTNSQIVLYLDKESQFPGGLRWADVKNKTNASTTAAGLMSAADKTKLDGVIAITNAQIDAICNASISNLSEVNF